MNTFEAFKALNQDAQLSEKLKSEAKTPEDVYEVLKGIGLDESFEEFKSSASEINDSLVNLDEAEMNAVAGGGDTITTLTTTTTASAAAAAAI